VITAYHLQIFLIAFECTDMPWFFKISVECACYCGQPPSYIGAAGLHAIASPISPDDVDANSICAISKLRSAD